MGIHTTHGRLELETDDNRLEISLPRTDNSFRGGGMEWNGSLRPSNVERVYGRGYS